MSLEFTRTLQSRAYSRAMETAPVCTHEGGAAQRVGFMVSRGGGGGMQSEAHEWLSLCHRRASEGHTSLSALLSGSLWPLSPHGVLLQQKC